jgi:hypothetical protein
MQEITLTLTLAEINQILTSLGEKPYKDVFQLVAKIQQQAQTQLASLENPASVGPNAQ